MKVLVIEDDLKTSDLLESGLVQAGHLVTTAHQGNEGLRLALESDFDFMILDVMLPGLSGLEILKSLRERKVNTPAMFLSAKHTLSERLEGLSAGSDDYLAKPFSLQEVLLRMEIILRRSAQGTEKVTELSYFDLKVNLVDREVVRSGKKIKLLEREFLLLEYFLRNPEKIITKSMILKDVLEYQFDPQTNVVDVFVHRLRTKIDRDFETKLIQTIRGVGYVLKSE